MLKDYLLGLDLVIDNEWLDKYCELIENNKTTPRQAYKTQIHHIVPKFYFKVMAQSIDNSSANTINLLIKDHLIAHYYLCGCATAKFKGKTFACISYILGHPNTLPDYKEFVKSLDHIEEYYLEYRKMINDAAHTTEAKEKASKSLKEFYANLDKNTEEWKARNIAIAERQKGRKVSKVARQKISDFAKTRTGPCNAFYGKQHSDETKATISKINGTKVVATDSLGNSLYFDSIQKALNFLKVNGVKTTHRRLWKIASKETLLGGYFWKILGNPQIRHMSEEKRVKLATTALKARGKKVKLVKDSLNLEFPSLNKAADYILSLGLDSCCQKNCAKKINNAAKNHELCYNCKWEFICK